MLFEVYGIPSKTYHLETHGPDLGWQDAPVVKTHLLPEQLPDALRSRKIVYLIRDGRDALVSQAHHRVDIFDDTASFDQCLQEAVYAAEGSHFGGWSAHVEAWIKLATVVIRFEDLIKNPLDACERLRPFLNMTEPNVAKLPSFSKLKHGAPEYGSGKYLKGENLASKWFRRGEVNGWKDEMPEKWQILFWHLHGETSEFVGYGCDGGHVVEHVPEFSRTVTVIIEADNAMGDVVNAEKRVVTEYLRAACRFQVKNAELLARVGGTTVSLSQALELADLHLQPIESGLLSVLKQTAHRFLPRKIYRQVTDRIPRNWFVKKNTIKKDSNTEASNNGFNYAINPLSACHSASGMAAVNRRFFYPVSNNHLLSLVRERYDLANAKFFLVFQNPENEKIVSEIVKAFLQFVEVNLAFRLVVIGLPAASTTSQFAGLKNFDRVRFVGYVRDVHLAAIYSIASGMISANGSSTMVLSELEALSCGCQLAVSSSSPMAGHHLLYTYGAPMANEFEKLFHQMTLESKSNAAQLMQLSWSFTWKNLWLRSLDKVIRTDSDAI